MCVYAPVNNREKKGKNAMNRSEDDLGQCLKGVGDQRRIYKKQSAEMGCSWDSGLLMEINF